MAGQFGSSKDLSRSSSRGMGGYRTSNPGRLPSSPTGYGVQQGFPGQQQQTGTPYSYPAPPITSNVQTPPFTSTAARDPQLQAMYDAWGAYRGQLAAGNDQDAINAMMRGRDVTSGMASEAEQNAAMRGIGPESGVSQSLQAQAMNQAQRNMVGLNTGLASDARRQQMLALGGQTGAAQAGATDLNAQRGLDIGRYSAQTGAALGQQQYGLAQWQAGQQAAQAAAQMQAMQNQQMWNQQMQMMNMASNIYSG